jgi:hypothetical protein
VAKIVAFAVAYFGSLVPVPFISTFMTTLPNKLAVSVVPQAAFFLGLEVFNRAEVIFSN